METTKTKAIAAFEIIDRAMAEAEAIMGENNIQFIGRIRITEKAHDINDTWGLGSNEEQIAIVEALVRDFLPDMILIPRQTVNDQAPLNQ